MPREECSDLAVQTELNIWFPVMFQRGGEKASQNIPD